MRMPITYGKAALVENNTVPDWGYGPNIGAYPVRLREKTKEQKTFLKKMNYTEYQKSIN